MHGVCSFMQMRYFYYCDIDFILSLKQIITVTKSKHFECSVFHYPLQHCRLFIVTMQSQSFFGLHTYVCSRSPHLCSHLYTCTCMNQVCYSRWRRDHTGVDSKSIRSHLKNHSSRKDQVDFEIVVSSVPKPSALHQLFFF